MFLTLSHLSIHVVIILSQGSCILGWPQVHCVAEYDLEFQNFCSLLLKFWEHRHAPQNLADNRRFFFLDIIVRLRPSGTQKSQKPRKYKLSFCHLASSVRVSSSSSSSFCFLFFLNPGECFISTFS